ncbi:MAG TPA: hypothetical protein VGO55_11055 [Allosphingosinicella sp.]|jgi:hypothetical protein|nr:hypothetical protein [Allosphingosinicella sp.]
MLTALLLAFAQPAPAPAPAPRPGIDVTASVGAYIDWRMCLDGRLGPPPRPRQPGQAELEAAFAACRSHEDSMRTATAAAFGPAQGAEVFERFVRGAREELGASRARR